MAPAQATADDVVVASHGLEEDDEERDGDDDRPGALGEFGAITIAPTSPVAGPPTPLSSALTRQRLAGAEPVPHHAGLGEGEGREDAEHVEVNQRVDVGAEDEDQRDRDRREHEHPVREDEPVAEVRELVGEETVPGHDRGQPWKALIRGVRGEDQDPEREDLNHPEHEMGVGRRWKVASAISERTETVSLGRAWT